MLRHGWVTTPYSWSFSLLLSNMKESAYARSKFGRQRNIHLTYPKRLSSGCYNTYEIFVMCCYTIKKGINPWFLCYSFHLHLMWVRGSLHAAIKSIRRITEYTSLGIVLFNKLRPRQNGRHCADGIFKYIFYYEICRVLLRFNCNLFLRIHLIISSIGSDNSVAPNRS